MERENARRVESEEQLAERRLKLDYEDLQAGARLAACTASWDNTLAASAAGEQVKVELQTNLRGDFTITEKAPTRAFS